MALNKNGLNTYLLSKGARREFPRKVSKRRMQKARRSSLRAALEAVGAEV